MGVRLGLRLGELGRGLCVLLGLELARDHLGAGTRLEVGLGLGMESLDTCVAVPEVDLAPLELLPLVNAS